MMKHKFGSSRLHALLLALLTTSASMLQAHDSEIMLDIAEASQEAAQVEVSSKENELMDQGFAQVAEAGSELVSASDEQGGDDILAQADAALAQEVELQDGKATAATESTEHTEEQVTVAPPAEVSAQQKSIPDWNFMVYLAANNNLHSFGIRNMRQMIKVGSTPNVNVLVQFDKQGEREIARYYVEKDNPILVQDLAPAQNTITGTPESLYSFVEWCVKNYPARHQCLVLWNHGSGIKDPGIWGRLIMTHRDELFVFNAKSGLLELERETIDAKIAKYFEKEQLIDELNKILKKRGIAFNDTYEEYLTNQDLYRALDRIKYRLLDGRNIDVLCMDACHMGMVEVGTQVRHAADFLVASEEVEPGSGYNYINILKPFLTQSFSPRRFAEHVVNSYDAEYKGINADYTQSAVDLGGFELLEKNIAALTNTFNLLFSTRPKGFNIKKFIANIRSSRIYTTSFCDGDYIDLRHFYYSVLDRLSDLFKSKTFTKNTVELLQQAGQLVDEGLSLMDLLIVKNASGVGLPKASGMAFYFPTRTVHPSYFKTVFDANTKWSSFLATYFSSKKRQA